MSRSTFLPETNELARLLARAGVGRATRPEPAAPGRSRERVADRMAPKERPTRPRFPAVVLPRVAVPDAAVDLGASASPAPAPWPRTLGSLAERANSALDWLSNATRASELFVADDNGLPIATRGSVETWLGCVAALASARQELQRLGSTSILSMAVALEGKQLMVAWASTEIGMVSLGWIASDDARVDPQLAEQIDALLKHVMGGLDASSN